MTCNRDSCDYCSCWDNFCDTDDDDVEALCYDRRFLSDEEIQDLKDKFEYETMIEDIRNTR